MLTQSCPGEVHLEIACIQLQFSPIDMTSVLTPLPFVVVSRLCWSSLVKLDLHQLLHPSHSKLLIRGSLSLPFYDEIKHNGESVIFKWSPRLYTRLSLISIYVWNHCHCPVCEIQRGIKACICEPPASQRNDLITSRCRVVENPFRIFTKNRRF